MQTYMFRSPNLILFGAGTVAQASAQVRRLGGSRVLIVTDAGIVRTGLLGPFQAQLESAGLHVTVYDGVLPDPRVRNVEEAEAAGRAAGCDLVIGFGGGSAMDAAKGTALVLGLGGSIRDYYGVEQVPARGVPSIMIPTTSGSGSEASTAIVLLDEVSGIKRVANATMLLADVAIIDPVLTLSVPPGVTADTGVDALIHAIEAYTASQGASPVSDALALEAIRLVGRHLRPAFADGRNLEARTGMAYAATIAGIAFTAAGLGAIHAMAYSFAEEHHATHGRSNAVLAPHVMAFNLPANFEKFARIAAELGEPVEGCSPSVAAGKAVSAVRQLLADLNISDRLRDYGVLESVLDNLAIQAYTNGTRLLPNNARQLTQEDACRIYRAAW
ncbi:MAG TPA: iron-containing alcohol dehydrogenase [Symbiobacteriaceae bacterium]|nr:iron-containing alcohol dehydrogenase [Symbiobacteriaceae bacterium]